MREVDSKLTEAIWANDVSQVKELLETGHEGEKPDLEATDETGWFALHNAAAAGSIEIVMLLLEHGADPNAINNDNMTPDKVAYGFRNDECGSLLRRARKEKKHKRQVSYQLRMIQKISVKPFQQYELKPGSRESKRRTSPYTE